jgi:hypothetical protein
VAIRTGLCILISVGAGGRYMFDFVATASKQGNPASRVRELENSEGLGSDTARACHFSCYLKICLVALFGDVLLEI